ncbi:hypothetical protein ARMGADRAFT_1040509 [Armillaria gallica]|uniref:Uncharacterized protein n=1 Tax=Armillaria gallica TaxID=47427 RepID=A0A2H3C9X2_ARMGA|nr:hypothetical protein ARMGADRAFT_1040509 [Armillaria gallica]
MIIGIMQPLHHNYHDSKKKHGVEVAKQIIHLQLSHLDELISAAEEEGLTEKSRRRKGAGEKLGHYLEELLSEKDGWGTTDGPAGMQLADGVCGVISMTGGAMRLVAGILSRLLKTYSSFRLYTHTACLSIHDNIVHMPRANIHTKHILHATNGWTSHFTPMQEKIVPVRGHMTAQHAGTGLDDG